MGGGYSAPSALSFVLFPIGPHPALVETASTRKDAVIMYILPATDAHKHRPTQSQLRVGIGLALLFVTLGTQLIRSEEHTSELQSLMRISYAVFCLKKKKRYKEYKQRTD